MATFPLLPRFSFIFDQILTFVVFTLARVTIINLHDVINVHDVINFRLACDVIDFDDVIFRLTCDVTNAPFQVDLLLNFGRFVLSLLLWKIQIYKIWNDESANSDSLFQGIFLERFNKDFGTCKIFDSAEIIFLT